MSKNAAPLWLPKTGARIPCPGGVHVITSVKTNLDALGQPPEGRFARAHIEGYIEPIEPDISREAFLRKQLGEESMVIRLLVAAGHVQQTLVDKARELARGLNP